MCIQCYFVCAMPSMCLYFESFSLNIFNKKPFYAANGELLGMHVCMIWRILVLHIQYGLVKAKIVKAKHFQKLFRG